MENKNKVAIKKIISEEIARLEKIKSLQAKKKQLSEAIKLLGESDEIDEWSFQGLKNSLGFAGKKAGDAATSAGASVGNAVAKKATDLGNKVATKATNIANKVVTGYNTLDTGLKQFSSDMGKAMTAGDIQNLEGKLVKIFQNLESLVKELNQKQTKLGVKPTTMKSLLFKAANKAKSNIHSAPAPAPGNAAIAEGGEMEPNEK